MSTSLLYHAFGLRGYRHLNSSLEAGRVTFCISQPATNSAARTAAAAIRTVKPVRRDQSLARLVPESRRRIENGLAFMKRHVALAIR